MTAPLALEERDELDQLLAECADPATLRARLAELMRLRSFAVTARKYHCRLPNPVKVALDRNVPRPSAALDWILATTSSADDDPRALGDRRLL